MPNTDLYNLMSKALNGSLLASFCLVIFFIIMACFITYLVTHKISKFTSKCNVSNSRFKGQFDEIGATLNRNAEVLNKRFNRIDKEIKENTTLINGLSNRIIELREEFKSVCSFLSGKGYLDGSLFQTKSPITLTDKGIEFIKKSGAMDTFIALKEAFAKKLLGNSPYKTYFDFDKACYSVVSSAKDKDEFNAPKNFIYENPVYNKMPVSLEEIIKGIAIMLREEMLVEYGGIVANPSKVEPLKK